MPLFHAQHIVKSVLALAPLHQEAVDIQDQDEGEQSDDHGPERHKSREIRASQRLRQPGVHRQRQQDVKAAQKSRLCQNARDVKPSVLLDVFLRNSGIESVFHPLSPPVRSIVRVSEIFLYSSSLVESPR